MSGTIVVCGWCGEDLLRPGRCRCPEHVRSPDRGERTSLARGFASNDQILARSAQRAEREGDA